MEVRKNKLYLYVLTSLLVFAVSIGQARAAEYENYFGIEMTNEQYNNLIELGFSSDEIYYMNQETFDLNKDLSATLVAKNQKYYKSVYTDLNGETYSTEITKEEYDNQSSIVPRGTVSTTYKTMVSTISQVSSKFRYKVTLAWKQMPSTRSYDIIGIGFEDDIYIDSSVYFNYSYCESSGDCITDTLYYYKNKKSTGGSAVYKIPSSAKSLTAVLYYDVAKNTSSTITSLDMCGDYSHATSNVDYEDYSGHNITLDGILLGSSISYYDAIPCAESSWSGSW